MKEWVGQSICTGCYNSEWFKDKSMLIKGIAVRIGGSLNAMSSWTAGKRALQIHKIWSRIPCSPANVQNSPGLNTVKIYLRNAKYCLYKISQKNTEAVCALLWNVQTKKTHVYFAWWQIKKIGKPSTFPATVIKVHCTFFGVHSIRISRNDQAAISIIIPAALGCISGIYWLSTTNLKNLNWCSYSEWHFL